MIRSPLASTRKSSAAGRRGDTERAESASMQHFRYYTVAARRARMSGKLISSNGPFFPGSPAGPTGVPPAATSAAITFRTKVAYARLLVSSCMAYQHESTGSVAFEIDGNGKGRSRRRRRRLTARLSRIEASIPRRRFMTCIRVIGGRMGAAPGRCTSCAVEGGWGKLELVAAKRAPLAKTTVSESPRSMSVRALERIRLCQRLTCQDFESLVEEIQLLDVVLPRTRFAVEWQVGQQRRRSLGVKHRRGQRMLSRESTRYHRVKPDLQNIGGEDLCLERAHQHAPLSELGYASLHARSVSTDRA